MVLFKFDYIYNSFVQYLTKLNHSKLIKLYHEPETRCILMVGVCDCFIRTTHLTYDRTNENSMSNFIEPFQFAACSGISTALLRNAGILAIIRWKRRRFTITYDHHLFFPM